MNEGGLMCSLRGRGADHTATLGSRSRGSRPLPSCDCGPSMLTPKYPPATLLSTMKNLHGEKRINQTHLFTTDGDARLYGREGRRLGGSWPVRRAPPSPFLPVFLGNFHWGGEVENAGTLLSVTASFD